MLPWRRSSKLLLLLALLTSCGQESGPSGTRRDPRPYASVSASGAVQGLVAQLQENYAASNWAAIRREIRDRRLASSVISSMQRWKAEQVPSLHSSLVHLVRSSKHTVIGTVSFASDARAVPEYYIFVFDLGGRHATITGTRTGIDNAASDPRVWSTSRTKHFLVYHSPFQLAGADRRFLDNLEHQRQLFARKFGVRLPSRALFFLYPERSVMDRLTGGKCGARQGETGCTLPFTNPPTIQALLRAVYHEPIHVYELALEPGPVIKGRNVIHYVAPLFIGEGTAVALEDREADPRLSDYCSDLTYAPLDECARLALPHLKPISLLADTGFRGADPGYAYSLGGSFVKYLILTFGYRKFGRFYYVLAAQPRDRVTDYNVASGTVYGQSIEQLIGAWARALCRAGC